MSSATEIIHGSLSHSASAADHATERQDHDAIRPMRITFLMPGYVWEPSGGARVVYEYANQLVRRGHDVTLVHPRQYKNAPVPPIRLNAGALLHAANDAVFGVYERFARPSLNWHPLDQRVRRVYVADPQPANIPDSDAIFATAWHTARTVLNLPPSKGRKFYLIQGYETWMGPRDVVNETWQYPLHKLVVSKWLMQVGRELGCENIQHLPNAIDHGRYMITRPIEQRPKQVAMMFSGVPVKGSADGIAALEMVRRNHPGLKIVLFGTSRRQSWVPRWAQYHRNPSQEFILNEIYNGSRVFLSPSWEEGFSLPVAEAAACGCAIVSTATGGIRDYIEDGISGLLSGPRDPAALAGNLRRMLAEDETRLQFARAAREAVSGLNWERSSALLEAAIAERVQES
jgi:L-malate glycosyltransferase